MNRWHLGWWPWRLCGSKWTPVNPLLTSFYSVGCAPLPMDKDWSLCTEERLTALIRRQSHPFIVDFQNTSTIFWPHPCLSTCLFAVGHFCFSFSLSVSCDFTPKTWANTSSTRRSLLAGWAAWAPLWYFLHSSAGFHPSQQRHCYGNLPFLGSKCGW
jgi:hypothetical protein